MDVRVIRRRPTGGLALVIIGDVVGRSGMNAVKNNIANIVQKENIHFIIVNGENATGGRGIKENEYDLVRGE